MAFDRIQSGVKVKQKKWARELECIICGVLETTKHILFQCPPAAFLWYFLRDSLGWSHSPTSCAEFMIEFIRDCRGITKKSLFHVCTGALWTLWKISNEAVFDKKVISSPQVAIYKFLALLKS